MKRQISLIVVAFVFLTVCLAIGETQEYDITQKYFIVQDISYKKDGSDYERKRCKLDLYMPIGHENFPLLIWFHGGGLKVGDKDVDLVTQLGKLFATNGVGVAIVNYRLYPKVKYPKYIEDAASAFAWVYNNIETYKGNPEQIFVSGHSAGGYLSAMVAMDERYLKRYKLSPRQLAGMISISGQMNCHSTVREERGIPITTSVIDESAPIFYSSKEAPPCLCICGDNDLPGLCEENRKFIEALLAAGHQNCKFKEVPERTHFSIRTNMNSLDDPVVRTMLTFVKNAGKISEIIEKR